MFSFGVRTIKEGKRPEPFLWKNEETEKMLTKSDG